MHGGGGRTNSKLVPLVKTAFAGLLLETHGGSESKTEEATGEKKRNVTFLAVGRDNFSQHIEPEGLELFLSPAHPHINFLAYRRRYRAAGVQRLAQAGLD